MCFTKALLQESNSQKSAANSLFSNAQYSQAIGEYEKALSSCPNYLEYEVAVLKSNIAACHLKLGDWKAAVESATAALDSLERLEPKKSPTDKKDTTQSEEAGNGGGVVEIEGEGDAANEELEKLRISDERRSDILRIRTKALMRRAKAKMELGGWGNLQGAEDGNTSLYAVSSSKQQNFFFFFCFCFCVIQTLFRSFANPGLSDYKTLIRSPSLPPSDKALVTSALATLPNRIAAAKEQEMGEMMGKLKELGNGILKPFGLSTDNFKMTKDEKTGGYSMQFG